jgi:hypothetical protein
MAKDNVDIMVASPQSGAISQIRVPFLVSDTMDEMKDKNALRRR